MKIKVRYWIMVGLLTFGFAVHAQDVKIQEYHQKVENLAMRSNPEADQLSGLIDGAAFAIFMDIGTHQPTEYTRAGNDILVLRAENPSEIKQLIQAFPQHLKTIRIIDLKWDGQSWPIISKADLDQLENLEYINLRVDGDRSGNATIQNRIQNSVEQLQPDRDIEVLYRLTEQAR